MMQINSNKQTPAISRDGEFLVSLKPEAIPWQPLFEGAEIATLSGDPNDGMFPYVIRVKHCDGLKVPPHWHSFDENITVLSGTWVMGLGERYDLSAAQEFPAISTSAPRRFPELQMDRRALSRT